MRRLIYTAAILTATTFGGHAQQKPDSDYLMAALTSLEAQRNSALNAQANAEAKLIQAQKEIEALKAQLAPKKEKK